MKVLPILLLAAMLAACREEGSEANRVDPAIERRREAEARAEEARQLAAIDRMRSVRVTGFLLVSVGAVGTLVWFHRVQRPIGTPCPAPHWIRKRPSRRIDLGPAPSKRSHAPPTRP